MIGFSGCVYCGTIAYGTISDTTSIDDFRSLLEQAMNDLSGELLDLHTMTVVVARIAGPNGTVHLYVTGAFPEPLQDAIKNDSGEIERRNNEEVDEMQSMIRKTRRYGLN